MAQNAKVHEDVHGPFVIHDNALFRPLFPVGYKYNPAYKHKIGPFKNETEAIVGSTVKALHLTGSPLARIKDGDRIEYWFCHGHLKHSYDRDDSPNQFKPDYFKWEE